MGSRFSLKSKSLQSFFCKNELDFTLTFDRGNWPENIEIPVSYDYYSSFRTGEFSREFISLGEYLNHKSLPEGVLCPEFPLPNALSQKIQIESEDKKITSEHAIVQLHAGRSGCFSPLHFDWDHRQVVHVCLSGRKRFILFPPEAGWMLQPVLNMSALCVARFSDLDRAFLLQSLGGVEIELKEGEAITFPSTAWHAVSYHDSSLALSIRFESSILARPLAVLPRSWYLQRLAHHLHYPQIATTSLPFLQEALDVFLKKEHLDWYARYMVLHKLYRKELKKNSEHYGVHRWVDDNFSSELTLAVEDLKSLYSTENPDSVKIDESLLKSTQDYIFRGSNEFEPRLMSKLSEYAIRTRQGLEPKRGLIKIKSKKGQG